MELQVEPKLGPGLCLYYTIRSLLLATGYYAPNECFRAAESPGIGPTKLVIAQK